MMTTATRYTLGHSHLVLGDTGRSYVLKVRDVPLEDRPREKICAVGPSALTTSELLAAILVTGTIKEDVLAMASRIIKEYGETSVMHAKDPATLATHLAIPLGKAVQIVAAAELGRRFFDRNSASAPIIRTASDVFDHVQDMRGLPKEHLRGLYLNSHYKLIHDEVLSIGTIDASIVHPREVFKPALEYSAAAVILVHNHPSGSTTSSGTDTLVTEQLVQAGKILGIDLIDHVIVTEHAFASIPVEYAI